MIPADGRLIQSVNLKIREDMLTGESADVSKDADKIVQMEIIYGKTEIIGQRYHTSKTNQYCGIRRNSCCLW